VSYFFFSSRRRHTRCYRDWSSDVCSSDLALLTDGRFSGATRGLMAGHVAPEAAVGGAIAAVEEGDTIVFDVERRRLDLAVDEAVIRARLSRWRPPAPHYTSGVFAEYAAMVLSAGEGP